MSVRETMPLAAEAGPAQEPAAGQRRLRSAPERFIETWIDAIVGFLFCVVLPIPIYATGEPFAQGVHGTEVTIISTALGYAVVWYCGRRLDAFPRASLQGNLGYVAPVAILTYGLIGTLLLMIRVDYSRIQFVGSGLLTLLWLGSVAQLRSRFLVRNYAVMPGSSRGEMPTSASCRWLDFDDVYRRGIRVDAIVADLSADLGEGRLEALADAAIAGVPVLDRRYIVETLTGRTPLGGLTPNEFGALLPSRQYLMVRRAIELLLTVAVLPILLPLLLGIAIVVRLDSPGPIFFLQTRIGRRGQPFRMVKFRTMRHGADGPSFTTTLDPRITRCGHFLRRSRLDELPQLFNILRGDMSWVGPRPEAATLEKGYVRDIEYFALRSIVRPGITGWAQINQGYAHEPNEMRSKLEYDLFYLKHCSLWLDLVIVLRTFAVVFRGTGAR